jgi:hypothetical protein
MSPRPACNHRQQEDARDVESRDMGIISCHALAQLPSTQMGLQISLRCRALGKTGVGSCQELQKRARVSSSARSTVTASPDLGGPQRLAYLACCRGAAIKHSRLD